MKKIAVGDLGEFWYGDYKEPFEQLEGGVPGHPVGVVLKADDGKLLCAFCGKTYENLGQHARHSHGLHAVDYKREVGLLKKSALVSERVRSQMAAGSLRAARRQGFGNAAWRQRYPTVTSAGSSWQRLPEQLNKTGRCLAQVLASGRAEVRERGYLSSHRMRLRGITQGVVERYFGTWEAYRQAVGAPRGRRVWQSSEMLLALRSLAATLGRTPTQSDMRRYGMPSASAYIDHFGSFADACRRAGLDPNLPVAMTEEIELQVLTAYATTGSLSKTAALVPVGLPAVRALFARYGFPYAPEYRGPGRREWAAEMARRLAGTEDQAA